MQDSPENTPSVPVVQQPKRTGLATASMVLGIICIYCAVMLPWAALIYLPAYREDWLPAIILCLGLVPGLPAIILGYIARSRARRAPEQYGGAGFAKTGIVTGWVSIFLTLLMMIAVPCYIQAHRRPSEKGCVNHLRQIDAAKEEWARVNRKKPGDPVVDEEVNAYLKGSQRLPCPASGVYTYNAVGVKPTCSLGPVLGHTL